MKLETMLTFWEIDNIRLIHLLMHWPRTTTPSPILIFSMTDCLRAVTDRGFIIHFVFVHKLIPITAKTSQMKMTGGGGTPLYRLYRYGRPQRVWFFGCFGHK